MRDIVGLYLHPPDKALVLCVDEKAQIQALDRSQPLLPMRPGQAERRSHDYRRHGTTTLFAALDFKASTVLGEFHHRHRAVEFRQFLQAIDDAVPSDLNLHLGQVGSDLELTTAGDEGAGVVALVPAQSKATATCQSLIGHRQRGTPLGRYRRPAPPAGRGALPRN